MKKDIIELDGAEPIHDWFELSYAQYLTIPRSVLQSMPTEWQKRFVECLEELDSKIDWMPKDGKYFVQLRDNNGRYISDPLMNYQRGSRIIEYKKSCKDCHAIEVCELTRKTIPDVKNNCINYGKE